MVNAILTADYGYIFLGCWLYWSLAFYTFTCFLYYLFYKIKGKFTYSIIEIICISVLGILGPFALALLLSATAWYSFGEYGQGLWHTLIKDRTVVSNSTKFKDVLDTTVD